MMAILVLNFNNYRKIRYKVRRAFFSNIFSFSFCIFNFISFPARPRAGYLHPYDSRFAPFIMKKGRTIGATITEFRTKIGLKGNGKFNGNSGQNFWASDRIF